MPAAAASRSSAIAAGVALLLVLALQDPALFRYNTQVASLLALLGLSGTGLVAGGPSTRQIGFLRHLCHLWL